MCYQQYNASNDPSDRVQAILYQILHAQYIHWSFGADDNDDDDDDSAASVASYLCCATHKFTEELCEPFLQLPIPNSTQKCHL